MERSVMSEKAEVRDPLGLRQCPMCWFWVQSVLRVFGDRYLLKSRVLCCLETM